ncbi:MAG: ABC transporter ATP-binding protein [Burkholderiales bacterium]|nr:ABC transporter ATP-binding protein [Opitutaceae bacterium]
MIAHPSQFAASAARPPLVRFSGLVKRFGDNPPVIDGIDFTAEHGDFVSLIGPSGCGKSTVLKLMSGLLSLSAGEIVIDGMTPVNAREELFYVFQEPTLMPWLTVQANVEMPLTIRGRPSHERAAAATKALALVGLEGRASFYPRELSGGQKMRVSIARALSMAPKVLLMDEPFGALDEMTRDHLNEELLAIRAQQAWTAFFVTHSVAEAVFLSNRIVVLSANPGRIHTEVKVNLPYPRNEDTRLSPEYQRLVAEVSRLLRSVERMKNAV